MRVCEERSARRTTESGRTRRCDGSPLLIPLPIHASLRSIVQEAANSVEIDVRLLHKAHVAGVGDYHEFAAGDAFMEDLGCARCRRPIVLAHNDERRLRYPAQLWAVVEIALAGVREVAKHLRRTDSLLAVSRWRLAVEVERHLHAQQLL